MNVPRATYSFRMSFWTVPDSADRCDAAASCRRDVHREQDDRRRVDGHRGRHAVEWDAVEQRVHVLDRVDRHPDSADFAGRERVIRVVANLRRQIEGHAQSLHAVRQQVSVSLIRFGCRPEPRVLPHRPGAAAIHVRLDPARKRKGAGLTDVGFRVDPGEVVRCAIEAGARRLVASEDCGHFTSSPCVSADYRPRLDSAGRPSREWSAHETPQVGAGLLTPREMSLYNAPQPF